LNFDFINSGVGFGLVGIGSLSVCVWSGSGLVWSVHIGLFGTHLGSPRVRAKPKRELTLGLELTPTFVSLRVGLALRES